jgi:diguanylate cyclase (GGDEF)-like protein/PAS domain S-box-containing protein
MVSVCDRDMRIILVNQAYERWRESARKELIGRALEDTVDAVEFEQSQPWATRALAGETVSYEREYPDALEIRHVSVSCVPLKMPDGSIEGYFSIAEDITRHREENIRLALLSERDVLTGVLNRAGFEQFIESKVNQREGAGLGILYIDLDHFKQVNDTYGHSAGDKVLQEFALRLLNFVRATDAVARLGGDEFAIILVGLREIAGAAKVAEKVVAAANEPFLIDTETQVSISASVGVACNAGTAGGWRALVEEADAMAYEAKTARGCFVLAPQTANQTQRRVSTQG